LTPGGAVKIATKPVVRATVVAPHARKAKFKFRIKLQSKTLKKPVTKPFSGIILIFTMPRKRHKKSRNLN
jgi:hypothetical protein